MTENKTKNILIQILYDFDDFAKMKDIEYPPVYLLGGSGCIIADYFSRATTDLDIIDMEYNSSMGRLLRILDKYDLLDLYLTTIPEDFAERALKINEFKNIFVLSREDIILSKIGRYSEKDIEDITILMENADKDLLVRLIAVVLNRKNISERVRNVFIENLEKFRRSFNV